jgi:hypothetical protein
MKTETQLRSEIYGAISTVCTTGWLSKPTVTSSFPYATYQLLDSDSMYSFGVSRSAETRTFQIDLYVNPSAIVDADNKLELIKTAMENIDYRQIGSNAEFLDSELNKIIKVTRWERINA